MDATHLKLYHGKAHRQQNKADGEAAPLAPGVEELLQPVEEEAGQAAQHQGQNDLNDRLHQHADNTDSAALHSGGHAKGGGEEHQAHRIVNGHYHQQKVGQGAVGLVLPHHHQGGGRGGGGGDGAQSDGGGQADETGVHVVECHQSGVHHGGGDHRLGNTHNDDPVAHTAQLLQPELIPDGKGDKAQGRLGDDIEPGHLLGGVEAQAGNAQSPQAERPQQKSGHQISGDGGQAQLFGGPGHEKSAHQSHRQADKNLRHEHSLLAKLVSTGVKA